MKYLVLKFACIFCFSLAIGQSNQQMPKDLIPSNFESVKKYLSLRIYPNDIVQARGGTQNYITKTDLEGTCTMLMLDLPEAFTPVSKEMFNMWSLDKSVVFKEAQNNINKNQIEKVTQAFERDGVKIDISFLGNEDYAASYALDLENNSPELVGDWGTVLAIPNKGLVELCKVSKDKPVDFVQFIQRVKPLVEKSFANHDHPVSDQFYWYYKGKFTKISVLTDSKGAINVIAPYGLTQLMTESK